jgi:hypothetical protein
VRPSPSRSAAASQGVMGLAPPDFSVERDIRGGRIAGGTVIISTLGQETSTALAVAAHQKTAFSLGEIKLNS